MNNTLKERTSGIFYGWWVVLAGFVIMGACVGIVSNCASQFIKPIAADLGYSRASVSMINTIFSGCYMAMSFMAGRILSRPDLHRLMKISLFVTCISYYCYSFCSSLASFYINTLIVGLAAPLLGVLAFSVVIPNWFIEQRGKAIGLSFMGSGVGGMIFNYLAGQWILEFGWRVAYQRLAIWLFVIMAPFVFFVLRVKPSDMGLEPLGGHHVPGGTDMEEEQSGIPFKTAIRSGSFWTLVLAITAFNICSYCNMQTISPHLSDIGYSATFAATMVSLAMGSLAIGKLSLGILFDKIGSKKATLLSALSYTVGVSALLFGRYKAALPFIFLGTCFGTAFGSVAIPIITEGVFGRKEYAAIYGFLSGTTSLLSVCNPTIANAVFDRAGSYEPCYIVGIVLSLVAAAIFTNFFNKMEKGKK